MSNGSIRDKEGNVLITEQEIAAAGSDLFEENLQRVIQREAFLSNIEDDILSDKVEYAVCDASGVIRGTGEILSVNEIPTATPIRNLKADARISDEEAMVALEEKMAAERETWNSQKQHPVTTSMPIKRELAPHPVVTSSTPAVPTISLESLGLGFLTTPPSLPAKSVKLQLSGQMKFSTTIPCHEFAVTDHFVILILDKRVKADAVDLALEDASIETTLITETDIIPVYPPSPALISYDFGVLRHFVFIRKLPETVE
jgi:hypothetical protein